MSDQQPFVLSQADSRPMYSQIIDQIKNKIAIGEWSAGFALPSIRELSVQLKVSVITVKRAYQELETAGVIITAQGKGSFVSSSLTIGTEIREREMDEHLTAALNIAQSIGLKLADVNERLAALAAKQAEQGEADHD